MKSVIILTCDILLCYSVNKYVKFGNSLNTTAFYFIITTSFGLGYAILRCAGIFKNILR